MERGEGRPDRVNMATVRVMHISDIHFGHSHVAEHVAAAEALAVEAADTQSPLDAIVVSGDLSQRARVGEFRAARALLDRLGAVAPLLVVSGNHDAEWWRAPLGFGDSARVHDRWRTIIGTPLEPTLRVPGVSIVGLNSAPGVMPWTLTWNPRDVRVKGGLTAAQLADARQRLEASPPGDLRVLVFHHNLVRGQLSNRWGLARPCETLDAIATIGPDVVCNGHDHEERAEVVVRPGGMLLASTANTLSRRARGKRVASLNLIEATAREVTVGVWHYDAEGRTFARQAQTSAPRRRRSGAA